MGTPFVEGPNVIVIPTSLFTETVFNAYVQNETLNETPIYSADEDIFKFISVGRDGDTQQACDEIDFIFIRFNISSQDAMEILNLLLECLVNETTNETAIVYSYASTKINGTSAVMMNLPISVLDFVPWFCNFENSPIGSKPETKSDAFWKGIKKLVSLAVGLIVAIRMAILELVELIAEFVMEILMEWLPILEFILWLIIRAIILIFIWIMFAITLILIISVFLAISAIILVLSPILEFDLNVKPNRITTSGDLNLTMEYNIGAEFNSFLAFYIPTIGTSFQSNNIEFELNFSLYSFYLGFNKFPKEIVNTTYTDWLTLLTWMGGTLGICAGGFVLFSIGAQNLVKGDWGLSFTILNALWAISLLLSFGTILSNYSSGNSAKYANIGMGIGFMIATVAAIFPSYFAKFGTLIFGADIRLKLKVIVTLLSIFNIRLKLWEELEADLKPNQIEYLEFKCFLSLFSGFCGLTLASVILSSIPNFLTKIIIAILTFGLGLIFIDAGLS